MRPDDPALSAEKITKSSGSNLALSFFSLSKERRRDMTIFYAFCRIIDDIADEEGIAPEERSALLNAWRTCVKSDDFSIPGLGAEVHSLIRNYDIPREHFLAIIEGCEMDITTKRYPDFESLLEYCYRVASAVGLVSIEVFGYRSPKTREYAVQLGYALQLTNITRDVATDWRNDSRIYLPADEMDRFGYSEKDLAGEVYNDAFVQLMEYQAARAESYFAAALQHRTPEDRPNLIAAEVMRAVYWKILKNLQKDRFRVFQRSYRLSKLTKLWTVLTTWASSPRPR